MGDQFFILQTSMAIGLSRIRKSIKFISRTRFNPERATVIIASKLGNGNWRSFSLEEIGDFEYQCHLLDEMRKNGCMIERQLEYNELYMVMFES